MKRRALSLLLALAMALGLCVSAFAAEEESAAAEPAAQEETVPAEGAEETAPEPETPAEADTPAEPGEPAPAEPEEDKADAAADEPDTASVSGSCGANGGHVTWRYADGTLTISGTGAMKDYKRPEDAPWAYEEWLFDIARVVVQGRVTHIGDYAFYMLGRVGVPFSVTLEEGITSIGKMAFFCCEVVSDMTLPASLTEIGEDALFLVATPAFHVASGNRFFKAVDGVLFDNSGRTLLQYPDGKKDLSYTVPAGVTTIASGALYGAAFTSVTFPDTLTAIGDYAFQFSEICSLDLPSGLKTLGVCAFWGCDSLQEVTIPASVTKIDAGAFGLMSPSDVTVLSPYCQIAEGSDYGTTTLGDPEVTVIHGYDGSTAESHARQYGFRFESLGPAPSAPPQTDPPVSQNTGWAKENGKWYYYRGGTKVRDEWIEDGGKEYYLGSSGAMRTGWIQSGDVWYYANSKGERQYGWKQIDRKWYYLNPVTGQMRTGFYDDGGKRYYSTSNGVMSTGWIKVNGIWYYADKSGALQTGWKKVGGVWYYFDPADYEMLTGRIDVDGASYYLNASGAMKTGWVSLPNGDYYYASQSGALIKDDWVKYRGSWYWLKADGLMARNETLSIGGKNYRFSDSGIATEVTDLYPAISLQVPLYKQADPAWANVHLGSSGKTMKSSGCLVTSFAMAESYRTGQTIYPDAMEKMCSFGSNGNMNGFPKGYTYTSGGEIDLEFVYELLRQNKPVIVGANGGGEHWVVVTGFTGGDVLTAEGFTINDPGASRRTLQDLFNYRPNYIRCRYYK